MKYEDCTCEAWKKYLLILIAQQTFAATNPRVERYPAEGVFKCCPWCSKIRAIEALSDHEVECFKYLFALRKDNKSNILEAPFYMRESLGLTLKKAKYMTIKWISNLTELRKYFEKVECDG
jgi:hypothetical protein